ncbi:MAG TPA: aldose 1-epimerase family protein [Tepidisphaeraceae bacterium]|jgi:hypothetical protein|nr:aldose 1-epimerase family protein [Tepidisphaeraceae bacterium]
MPNDPPHFPHPPSDPYAINLSTAFSSQNIQHWEGTGKEITPDCPVSWSVKKYPLHGGKQEGVDVILLDNGKLKITIIPTRGMGIYSVTSGDVRLGWDSPVKEIVNPVYINLQSRGGLGWLEGFNEWFVRCGLEWNGHPGTDKFINNVGDEATMELTLHGKIQNTPASEVEVVIDRKAPYRIHVRGRVDERMFYGPKLELWTDVSTVPGSTEFRIDDVITNRGADKQEFEMLYHTNYGKPLLEEGSTCMVPAERIMPFNATAAKGMAERAVYAAPKLGFIEQVYCVFPKADKDGRTLAMLENKAKDRAISLSWSTSELPYFTQWKNTTAMEEGYVTGLEPGTGFAWNRRIEREAGRVPKLDAGASRHFAIDFAIHVGTEDVKKVADRIAAIQGDKAPVLDEAPPKVTE